ncbi:MAG: NADH-quinone oxidoreductase subunit NuoH [Elusimicrobia bacterium]|nr:NADH-quinone oxidoreductase subunit NuoH [Elusimicrobiota bacterium]
MLGLGGLASVWFIGEISDRINPLYDFAKTYLEGLGIPLFLIQLAWTIIKAGILLMVPVVNAICVVWWERKISAHMQSRLGPMYVGGWHGWLQTIADSIKLLLKEDITPNLADKKIHLLATAVALAPAIAAFAPVSFGKELVYADIDIGILYVFAVSGISVFGIIMAGWASANKYSMLGGLRAAAQMVSYEIPRTFSVVPVIMLCGTLNIAAIAEAQSGYLFGFLPRWFIFYPVVGQIAFIVFLIASVAETNRVPFDIPEAESELVAGFSTEYSGIKFSMFFLAEYSYVLISALLISAFFLGGGSPLLPSLSFIPSWAWFIGKALFIIFCFLWFRWTFPRFRVDRLMDFNWKFLFPLTLINILLAGIWSAEIKHMVK